MKLHFPFLLSLALSAALLPGCALLREKPPSAVNDSQLNWITVRYYPENSRERPCFLNIIGAGSVEFRQGFSPRVFNPFSQEYEHKFWNDIETEKLGMPPNETRWIMQLFVDAGLLCENDRLKSLPERERNAEKGALAVFSAKINNKQYFVRTRNPALAEVAENIISSILSNRGFR